MATLEKLQRHVFGKRSEKIPRIADELKAANPGPTQEADRAGDAAGER